MAKKIFGAFLIISILTLVALGGWYYLKEEQNKGDGLNVVLPNFLMGSQKEDETDNEEDRADTKEEPSYQSDVYSVHLCDGYSDGTFAIRNIKLGMTFRQVVNFELKNVGVYVENDEYGKDTFYAMSSNEDEGKDLLPVTERALLGNPCEIVYNFTTDITIEEPAEYPYLESVQYLFLEKEGGADPKREIEEAFSDSFGDPVTDVEGNYYMSVFTGTKDKVSMFYEYREKTEDYNLRYIIWEKFEE